ncbi:leucine-rich repeat and immunoglobulin-like domain-containing nogo receptor-interacting protein 1 [Periophthalmus magnuspinnatus]|uniref:leucine-rich repeat and immunoglobulin-like domain-containing nogo receptor-interacting protein 1 n=1 Tax=Periophthalmus magnuspinnatus TaxID=409849 RepID=UPI00145A9072|nr:leucine-rich repeat and immunoglobulin-like domain-containing nogo receptor-interacting protein 1 [Periophthalmus magnuspinnatus]
MQAGLQMFLGIMLNWAALYLFGAGVALSSEIQCPQPCFCNASEQMVNCTFIQLTTIPNNLPLNAKSVSLTHNKIRSLGSQQFQGLTRLHELDLSDNILAIIEVQAFVGLQALVTLKLARNHLKIIPVEVFSGLPKLQLLDISDNEILVLLAFTFRDLPSLRCLKASQNDLVFVSHNAFTGLTNLQELYLDGGNLTEVPTRAITQLGELKTLNFHHFGLVMLPNFSLYPLGHLKELFISQWAMLETLSVNSLFGLNLTSLTITHCNLSTVPYIPLHHLVYLVRLDLSYNPITYIYKNVLGGLLRLQEFQLVGGSLLHIELDGFKGLVYFRVLNISRNYLTTLESGIFHSINTLKVLGLDNNPLVCDCRLLWVVKRQSYLNFGGNLPVCTKSSQEEELNFLEFSQDEISRLLTCRRPRIRRRKKQEVTVEQGHTVMLYCNAEGDPWPSVTWLNPGLRPLSPIGRLRALPNGSLEVRYAQPQDSGTYVCVASNAAGNDTLRVTLNVRSFPSSAPKKLFRLKSWFAAPSATPDASTTQDFPFDVKTLLIATTIGFLSFSSSVCLCFIFMFFWSKSKGQIKHTATIAYVPRSTMSNSNSGNCAETTGRFTMKLL